LYWTAGKTAHAMLEKASRRVWVFMNKDSNLKKGEAGTGRLIAAALSLPSLKAGVSRA
jgi:hypothetical protein